MSTEAKLQSQNERFELLLHLSSRISPSRVSLFDCKRRYRAIRDQVPSAPVGTRGAEGFAASPSFKQVMRVSEVGFRASEGYKSGRVPPKR